MVVGTAVWGRPEEINCSTAICAVASCIATRSAQPCSLSMTVTGALHAAAWAGAGGCLTVQGRHLAASAGRTPLSACLHVLGRPSGRRPPAAASQVSILAQVAGRRAATATEQSPRKAGAPSLQASGAC